MKGISKLIILGFSMIYLSSCSPTTCYEILERILSPIALQGKISQKYRAKRARNIRTLIIKNNDEDLKLTLFDIHAYLYDACNEGDSLLKEKGSRTFIVKRPNGERKEIILDCIWRD